MKQYELNGKEFLFVPLKGFAENVFLNMGFLVYTQGAGWIERTGKITPAKQDGAKLPDGNWKLFGQTKPMRLAENLKEEQCIDLVQETSHTNGLYLDYTDLEHGSFVSPSASFRSWLRSEGIKGNHAILTKI